MHIRAMEQREREQASKELLIQSREWPGRQPDAARCNGPAPVASQTEAEKACVQGPGLPIEQEDAAEGESATRTSPSCLHERLRSPQLHNLLAEFQEQPIPVLRAAISNKLEVKEQIPESIVILWSNKLYHIPKYQQQEEARHRAGHEQGKADIGSRRYDQVADVIWRGRSSEVAGHWLICLK